MGRIAGVCARRMPQVSLWDLDPNIYMGIAEKSNPHKWCIILGKCG